jgi:hypothetical protein
VVLSAQAAVAKTEEMIGFQRAERQHLDEIRRYWRGKQQIPAHIPSGVPQEVKALARIARVNICELVVNSLGQSMVMDGFRAGSGRGGVVDAFWDVWQRNRMDRDQSGLYRSAFAYGTSYTVVTPGDTAPTVRPVSPRSMTTVYGEDPDWPMWALERWDDQTWRLFDEEDVYYVGEEPDPFNPHVRRLRFLEARSHGVRVHGRPVCPVIRYRDEIDLDAEDDVDDDVVAGQVAPLRPLQDQVDLTTFGLLVSQHYTAFRQRFIIGWVAPDETTKLKMGASQTWTFDDHPDDVKIGELSESDLKGYLASREASLRHAASLSQTPAHELIGELVNLSAEALAAAEAGRDRKTDEAKTLMGESNEQTAQAVGSLIGVDIPDDAQAVWRDTSAKSFSQLVDALGKAAQMLGIPPQALWERLPNTTLQDVEDWKTQAQEGDAFSRLADMIDRQAANVPDVA